MVYLGAIIKLLKYPGAKIEDKILAVTPIWLTNLLGKDDFKDTLQRA